MSFGRCCVLNTPGCLPNLLVSAVAMLSALWMDTIPNYLVTARLKDKPPTQGYYKGLLKKKTMLLHCAAPYFLIVGSVKCLVIWFLVSIVPLLALATNVSTHSINQDESRTFLFPVWVFMGVTDVFAM